MIIDERWALCQRLRAVIFKFRYINYYKPIEIYYITMQFGELIIFFLYLNSQGRAKEGKGQGS